jgi:hypothetical protein
MWEPYILHGHYIFTNQPQTFQIVTALRNNIMKHMRCICSNSDIKQCYNMWQRVGKWQTMNWITADQVPVVTLAGCNLYCHIKTPWPEYASKLYWPSDCCLLANSVPTFVDTGCHMVSVMDPYGRILGFLDQSRYFLFQIAPQLYSWGWVDPIPDPLLPRKSGSAGNWTQTSGSVARNSDN